MKRVDYFERCRRTLIKIVKDHKKMLQNAYIQNKNQGKLFETADDEQAELKLSRAHWQAMDALERYITYYKGVK